MPLDATAMPTPSPIAVTSAAHAAKSTNQNRSARKFLIAKRTRFKRLAAIEPFFLQRGAVFVSGFDDETSQHRSTSLMNKAARIGSPRVDLCERNHDWLLVAYRYHLDVIATIVRRARLLSRAADGAYNAA
jgi:hypothetical protein